MLGGGGKRSTDKTPASNQQTISAFFKTTGNSELAAATPGDETATKRAKDAARKKAERGH
jgi:hypothetical protein